MTKAQCCLSSRRFSEKVDFSSGAIGNWYAYPLGPNAVLNQENVASGTRATFIPDVQGSIIGGLDASSGTLTKYGY